MRTMAELMGETGLSAARSTHPQRSPPRLRLTRPLKATVDPQLPPRRHPRHRGGTDRVPPGLLHRPPHHHREAARPARSTTPASRPTPPSSSSARSPRRSSTSASDIVRLLVAWVARPRRRRGARAPRLPAGLGRHRRLDPGGHRRLPAPRTSSSGAAAQPVGGRGRAHPVERGHVARRAAATRCSSAPGSSAARARRHAARRPGHRPRAVLLADPRCLPLRRDDLRRPVPRASTGVTATRLSFFMAIPALTAAGLFEAARRAPTTSSCSASGRCSLGIVVAFVVAYASIAWLLRSSRSNSITAFVWYRVALGPCCSSASGRRGGSPPPDRRRASD